MSGPDIWPFHVRAFLGDTEKLSAAERGAYICLLCFYWHNRGLPQDDDQLRRISKLSGPAWKRSRPRLQGLFKPGWRHERVDADLAYVEKLRATKSAAANTRWGNKPGEKNMSRESSTRMSQPELFQGLNNFPSHAYAMPKEDRIESLPLELDSTSAVEKSQAHRLPESLNGQPSKQERRAQHAWEAALCRELGSEHYARALEILGDDMALVERATRAEMRRPGSGSTAALLGLRGRLVDGKPGHRS